MARKSDFRSWLVDAASCAASLAGGLRRILSDAEELSYQLTEPRLDESRFWVLGRRGESSEHVVLAWSPVRLMARAAAELAIELGADDVTLVDCDTDEEERVRRAA